MTENGTLFRDSIRETQRVKGNDLEQLRRVNFKWPFDTDGSTTARLQYDDEAFFGPFLEILGFEKFADMFAERKAQGKTTNVLDLFGAAPYVDEQTKMNIDEVLGVKGITGGESTNPVLVGDLYADETWAEIEKIKKDKSIDGFDIITCRPLGHFGRKSIFEKLSINQYRDMYYLLLRKAYRNLRQEGVIMTEIPVMDHQSIYTEEEFLGFQQRLKELSIDFHISGNNLMLRRLSGSPDQPPF